MREGWARTTLGKVAQRTIGKTPPRKQSKYWTDDTRLPFCTIKSMQNRYKMEFTEGVTEDAISDNVAKLAPRGALLLSFKLSIGRIRFAPRDLYFNEAIAWIRPNESIVSKQFLALALEEVDWESLGARAVKGKTLNSQSLDSVPLAIPPLDEQRRIVDLMDAVDATIGAAQAAVDAAEMLRTRLRDRFPSSCPIVPISQVLQSIESGTSTKYVTGPGEPSRLLTLAAIRPGVFHAEEIKSVGAAQLPDKSTLSDGDLLITRSNTPTRVGYVAIAHDVPPRTYIPDLVWRLVPDQSQVSAEYLAELLSSPTYRQLITGIASGTNESMQKINKANFGKLRIPVPPFSDQATYLGPLRTLADAQRADLAALDRLRDLRSALLSVLLSGEHEIPESYDQFLSDSEGVHAG